MTRQVTLGSISADHGNQRTHVEVEIWDLVADGIRRRVDKFEMTFGGATLDYDLIKRAVSKGLIDAGLADAETAILTQAEARK